MIGIRGGSILATSLATYVKDSVDGDSLFLVNQYLMPMLLTRQRVYLVIVESPDMSLAEEFQ